MSVSPPLAPRLAQDPDFARLKDHLIEVTGLAYYADKNEALAERIARRLQQLGLDRCDAYLALLHDSARGEAELDAVIDELTIGETFFFRHRELFDALRERILPELIERNQHSRRLRIWSAGCATGAEPYSVAILLRRDLAARLAGWDITIVATDINRAFLARAREGRFEEWAFRGSSEDLKHSCFLPAGKSWVIAPAFREGVSFQYHNLVRHPYPSLVHNLFAFDVILCRNVAIYFSTDIVRRLVDQLHRCLVEGGWLLVGPAEPSTDLFRSFRRVSAAGAVLYQKISDQAGPSSPSLPEPVPALAPEKPRSAEKPRPVRIVAEPRPAYKPVEKVPASHPADLAEVRSLADRGEWEEAAGLCARLLARDSLNPQLHFLDALLQEQAGLHAQAEDALRKALYLDRRFVLAHYYRGLVLQRRGEAAGAARSFRNALEILANMDEQRTLDEADGATVADLKKLTHMHLAVLEGA